MNSCHRKYTVPIENIVPIQSIQKIYSYNTKYTVAIENIQFPGVSIFTVHRLSVKAKYTAGGPNNHRPQLYTCFDKKAYTPPCIL